MNTVELYKTHAHNYAVSDDILIDGRAVDMAKNTDQISMYWFPEFKEVVVANWTIVKVETPGTDYTNDHTPSVYNNFAIVSALAKEIAFGLTESKCAVANTLGKDDKNESSFKCLYLTLNQRLHCSTCDRILFGVGSVDAVT